jgi:hypothetical protein
MKKTIVSIAVVVSALLYGQRNSLGQALSINWDFKGRTELAINKINSDRELTAALGKLAKADDKEGLQKLLVQNGAPNALKVSKIAKIDDEPAGLIYFHCKYFDGLAYDCEFTYIGK